MRVLILAAALALSACATAPVLDKRAAAEEVFRLSGGLNDLRLLAQFAPAMVDAEDVKQRCLASMGRNPNPLARAACDMIESAAAGLRTGQGGLSQAFERQIAAMESRAIDAMVETYTAEELAAMRRYYASPEGRSIVAKRGEYLRRLAAGG
jgi:hypothetical protein